MPHATTSMSVSCRWIERGNGGHLVITASAAGLLTQVGSLPYSVTKHATVSIAEWLAITHADDGISISCLCPQAVQTGMLPDAPEGSESNGGGAAGGDGVISPREVADEVVAAMHRGDFLILPHKEVHKYYVSPLYGTKAAQHVS